MQRLKFQRRFTSKQNWNSPPRILSRCLYLLGISMSCFSGPVGRWSSISPANKFRGRRTKDDASDSDENSTFYESRRSLYHRPVPRAVWSASGGINTNGGAWQFFCNLFLHISPAARFISKDFSWKINGPRHLRLKFTKLPKNKIFPFPLFLL